MARCFVSSVLMGCLLGIVIVEQGANNGSFQSPTPVAQPPSAFEPPYLNAVAVLWFTNKGKEQDWLRTGLTDLLISALAQIPYLQVLERERLDRLEREHRFSQIQQAEAVQRLSRLERVKQIVVGTFEVKGGRIVIDAAVIDAETGKPAGAVEVEGELEVLAALVEKLAKGLAKAMKTPVSEAILAKMRLVPTDDFTALQWHVRGKDHFARGEYADALEAFWRAGQRDEKFLWAWEAMGQTYEVLNEIDHALLTCQRLLMMRGNLRDILRDGVRASRLMAKKQAFEGLEGNPPSLDRELEVLGHALGQHPLAKMPLTELRRKYRSLWVQIVQSLDSLEPSAAEQTLVNYQKGLIQKGVTFTLLAQMRRYAKLLEARGERKEAFLWWDRVLYLGRRFLASLQTDDELVRHALQWKAFGHSVAPMPEWVVTVDPQKPRWSLPQDLEGREKFHFLSQTSGYPVPYYGVVFLAPSGYYFVKATVDGEVGGLVPLGTRYAVPRLLPVDPQKGIIPPPDPDMFRESFWQYLSELQSAYKLPSPEKEKRLAELHRERQRGGLPAPREGYLNPPGTVGMWLTEGREDALSLVFREVLFPRSEPFTAKLSYPSVRWEVSFDLTRSPQETLLKSWGKLQGWGKVRKVLNLYLEPLGTKLWANDEPVVQRSPDDPSLFQLPVPEGERVHLVMRSPDGKEKGFSIEVMEPMTLTLSVRNGWEPLPELFGGQGFLCLDRKGLLWLVSVHRDPFQKTFDLYLQTSRDGRRWSQPKPLPVNSSHDEISPVLVQQPDGLFRLFWSSNRPTPEGEGRFLRWTATSTDGIHWSEPKILDEGLAKQFMSWDTNAVFGTPRGLAAFFFYGDRAKVWFSEDGQKWEGATPTLSGYGPEVERLARLLAVSTASDGTLRGLCEIGEPFGSQDLKLAEAVSVDGLHWELLAKPFALPKVQGLNFTFFFRTKQGWLTWAYYQAPGTAGGRSWWLLLRPQKGAFVLPPLFSPYNISQWMEFGNLLLAVHQVRDVTSPVGFTYLWVCPMDALADKPLDELPRFEINGRK